MPQRANNAVRDFRGGGGGWRFVVKRFDIGHITDRDESGDCSHNIRRASKRFPEAVPLTIRISGPTLASLARMR
jgi:hypothetical protein